jgi:pSer/pThr/pTyr-binding forkhead associated (FHA) protein
MEIRMAKQYKYQCRPCPSHIRRRCIEEAHMSPGVKRIIERAFESHTDTQATWDLLQPNCLLVQRDQMVIGRQEAEKRGLLSRMRKRTDELPEEEPAQPLPVVKPPSPIEPGWKPNWEAELRTTQAEDTIAPSQESLASDKPQTPSMTEHFRRVMPESSTDDALESRLESTVRAQPQTTVTQPPAPPSTIHYPLISRPSSTPVLRGPRILVAASTGHRILLPEERELVFGRFDPLTHRMPDIDLTYEDQFDRGISRRHCQVSGWRGQYEISDLGSSNGTWVNGTRLGPQERHSLNVGDEIRLGTCCLYFDQAPALWRDPPTRGQYFVYITFTGRYLPLPDQNTILIGRADPSLGFTPDVDLGAEEDASSVVSRRHARLIRRESQFLIEDLGSAFKTRVNGEPVPVGTQVPIHLGQHLWLGGYVLAFDVVER